MTIFVEIVEIVKGICAVVLILLIFYVEIKKFLRRQEERRRESEERCKACGRVVSGEFAVRKEIGGAEFVFCCEHCASAYEEARDKQI